MAITGPVYEVIKKIPTKIHIKENTTINDKKRKDKKKKRKEKERENGIYKYTHIHIHI